MHYVQFATFVTYRKTKKILMFLFIKLFIFYGQICQKYDPKI